MADITNEIQKIGQAVYGEEVRGAIMDALEAMNEQAAAAQEWATGADDPTAEPGETNNAAYYAAQAAVAAGSGIAALENEAQTFDATTAYSAGDYVIYDGLLYRFVTVHAAGAWTGTDAAAVTLGQEIKKNNNAIHSIMPYELQWTIGSTISASGNITGNAAGAMSSTIPVDGGNIVTRAAPVTDNNGVSIIIHVCQYVNGVFTSRTSLGVNGLTLASDTTSVIFNCSRAASTGIEMTQSDIDNYFTAKLYRKYVLATDWKSMLRSVNITSEEASNTYSGLLANLPENTYTWTSGSWWSDGPWSDYSYIFTLRGISSTTFTPIQEQATQIALNPENGKLASRRIKSGTWTDWNIPYNSRPVYYAFGDSLTWGAVWDNNQSTPLYQADLNQQIPTRIANAIGSGKFYNLGESGARFVRQSGDSPSKKTIVDIIKETTLTGAQIVTIGGGRNDSATALGDGDTATANDGTICGAIADTLSYLTTNYPKLQIVVYGVTPQPTTTSHDPSDIYTRVFAGGWSLTTYYAEVAKVCARFGVPFIDWYDCTLILRWGVLSGGYSEGVQNWSHPISGDIYTQMGNYLGGRVAAYYQG